MNRYICIHGHFYQPPRENPWIEEVEREESAHPYHDWNEKISAECYGPNGASRILNTEGEIVDIVNNYAAISFNFGPTLLSWLARHEPDLYQAVLDADRISRDSFSGHGSAMAQAYNHIIMPLATNRDKTTQVIWGIRDFEYRFGRRPEGMWLPETAVDLETLEVLAQYGIKFTVLAPEQAKRVRTMGETKWTDVSGGSIDPKTPYLCRLPSGRLFNLFFYDGQMARDVSFGDLLRDGKGFARRLLGAFVDQDSPQLVHIATDGETYGHHHRFADMALAYCLTEMATKQAVRMTNYAEYLERYPPSREVEVAEDSAWSCSHGIGRWKEDCGCSTGVHPEWHQKWRAPLRRALDTLNESLGQIYEGHMSKYSQDPWELRNGYVELLLERTPQKVDGFLQQHTAGPLSRSERVKVLKLLEMQRHAMRMFTSCAWFFDEVSRAETIQVLKCAARAIQLAQEISEMDLEPAFLAGLRKAPSNLPELVNAANLYEKVVKPGIVDFSGIAAHTAMESVFDAGSGPVKVYCYTVHLEGDKRLVKSRRNVITGRVRVRSDITEEEIEFDFAAMQSEDRPPAAAVRPHGAEYDLDLFLAEAGDTFDQDSFHSWISKVDEGLGGKFYTLRDLFPEKQRAILEQIVSPSLLEIESYHRRTYERHLVLMKTMREMRIPISGLLSNSVEIVLNCDFRRLLAAPEMDVRRMRSLIDEARTWSVEFDKIALSPVATRRLDELAARFASRVRDLSWLHAVETIMGLLEAVSLDVDSWKLQNAYFTALREVYPSTKSEAERGEVAARNWVMAFELLGSRLQVKVGGRRTHRISQSDTR